MISLDAGHVRFSLFGPVTLAMPRLVVIGTPVPAPRPRGNQPWTESGVAEWRRTICAAVVSAPPVAPIMAPVIALGVWRMPRPPAHFSGGRLRPDAPALPSAGSKNDIDNLEKPVYDALQDVGILARGDGSVIGHAWVKIYADRATKDTPPELLPGISIELYSLPDLRVDGSAMKHSKPTRRVVRPYIPDPVI